MFSTELLVPLEIPLQTWRGRTSQTFLDFLTLFLISRRSLSIDLLGWVPSGPEFALNPVVDPSSCVLRKFSGGGSTASRLLKLFACPKQISSWCFHYNEFPRE